MNNLIEYGYFRGRQLVQKRGSIGGARNVFVKLQGIKNELFYPTFGGVIKNPFKGNAKMFAGDLCWYKTDENGVNPELYILKTYEVLATSGTTVSINKGGGFRHIPFVGDVLMVAPDVMGGTGTSATVTNVTSDTEIVDGVSYPVWKVTTSASLQAKQGDVLVEADEDGKMLCETVNAVFDCDADFIGTTVAENGEDEFDLSRYIYAPALRGIMYISKMSPMPKCVLNLNNCNVNGWFEIDFLNKAAANTAKSNE